MRELNDIRGMLSNIRKQIEDGADPSVILSALTRAENRVSALIGADERERTDPSKRASAGFFTKKKKREGNWENPLEN